MKLLITANIYDLYLYGEGHLLFKKEKLPATNKRNESHQANKKTASRPRERFM